MRAGFICRKARIAARMLEPVAIPSSTRMTVFPLTSSGGSSASVCAFATLQFLSFCRGNQFDIQI